MKCPKCGRDLPYGAKYCLFCNIHVENSEIPTPTEPTRVMPPVGETKKKKENKPKLKPEKKRKLILFYSSIAAIVLILVLLVFILVHTFTKPKKPQPSFSFSSSSQTSSANTGTAESSAVSLPVYSTVDRNPSSAAASSSDVSSAAESTVSKPTVLPAAQYLHFTVADLKKNFGQIASKDANEGQGSILTFAGCKYKFIVESETLADSDRVSAVIVTAGGEIIPGAAVGQTYNQLFAAFGTSFQFSYDKAEEIAVATTRYNGANFYIYFEKEDKNIPSISALIKQN